MERPRASMSDVTKPTRTLEADWGVGQGSGPAMGGNPLLSDANSRRTNVYYLVCGKAT